MSRTVLENLIGTLLPTGATLADLPMLKQEPDDLQAGIALAMNNRLELRVVNANKGAAQAVKKIAKGSRLPSMAAFGTVGYGKPGLDIIKKEWMDYWMVGVAAEWKLWNGGQTRSQIQQSEIRMTALDEMDRQIREAITLEVTQAYLQVQEVQQRQSVSRTMEQQALESYRVAEQQYHQGVSTQTDFFDAQSVLTRSRLSLAQANIDWCLALTNWRRALGIIEKPYVK
jgi:outer membrane protein